MTRWKMLFACTMYLLLIVVIRWLTSSELPGSLVYSLCQSEEQHVFVDMLSFKLWDAGMLKRAVFIQFYLLCLYPSIVQILQLCVESMLHLGLLFTWLWPSNNSETQGCQKAAVHSNPESVSPACQIWLVLLWVTVVLGNTSDYQSAVWKKCVCKKIWRWTLDKDTAGLFIWS